MFKISEHWEMHGGRLKFHSQESQLCGAMTWRHRDIERDDRVVLIYRFGPVWAVKLVAIPPMPYERGCEICLYDIERDKSETRIFTGTFGANDVKVLWSETYD